jgi:uncharacterized protein (DUF1697 family)
MHTYIAILRGINVSGRNKILMADLKALFEGMGFLDIKTYIQSGNVIFKSKEQYTESSLEDLLQQAIRKKYGFDVPVLVRDSAALEKIISQNPFLKEKDLDQEKLHVTFLAGRPEQEAIEKIKAVDFLPDRFKYIGREIYLHCPERYGETKLSNSFFEKKLKVRATTRNWKTVNKLFEIASETH